MRFRTGLEPLLEKLAMGEQLSLPFHPPAAAPGLLSRAGSAVASGGRMLGNAASQGFNAARRTFNTMPRDAKMLGGGLGALGLIGAGGLAYRALSQHENDAQKNRQIYTPMTGSIYG